LVPLTIRAQMERQRDLSNRSRQLYARQTKIDFNTIPSKIQNNSTSSNRKNTCRINLWRTGQNTIRPATSFWKRKSERKTRWNGGEKGDMKI
jgi:translation initiation factor 2 beta subunit (eIF-2beta)/eIF-5